MAHSDSSHMDPTEVDGQLIFMQDETTVKLELPILIG